MALRMNAVLVGVLAMLLGIWGSMPSASVHVAQDDIVPGRNKTILIFSSDMQGTSSAHVAVAFALAQKHPDVSVHYASSPALAPRIAHISAMAANRSSLNHDPTTKDNEGSSNSSSSSISFHALSGASYRDSVYAATGGSEGLVHAPGLKGTDGFCRCLMSVADMWSEDDHVAQYKSARAVIAAIDPSLVVMDVLMGPAAAAARDARRRRAVISPSTIASYAPSVQPVHAMLWKYPFMASGLSYPMKTPSAIFTNIAFTAKMIVCIVRSRSLTAKKAPALQARGVESVPDLISSYDPAVPWITQTLPGAHVDLLNIPDNFVLTGPINLEGVAGRDSGAATAGLDPLLEWVRRAPTVLVNMGSMYEFKEPQLRIMAAAIDRFLEEIPGIQILWKAQLAKDIVVGQGLVRRDNIAGLLASLCRQGQEDGRVRITQWLDVEPPTLLREKQLVAYIHHGGAGGFSDALSSGVPQIILPQWTDLYDYATLVEYLGIGLWPCREISPSWEAECLSSALAEVLATKGDGGEVGSRGDDMRIIAARFRDRASMSVGRDVAAREIVRLAYT